MPDQIKRLVRVREQFMEASALYQIRQCIHCGEAEIKWVLK